MPIDPADLDERAVKSYRAGEETVVFRDGKDREVINQLESAKAVACDPTKVYNFFRNFNLNVKSEHFPEYE